MPLRTLPRNNGTVRLAIEGAFRPDDAERICALVADAGPSAAVEVDFGEAGDVPPVALAVLARSPAAGALRLRRLRETHRRILAYLGLAVPTPPRDLDLDGDRG